MMRSDASLKGKIKEMAKKTNLKTQVCRWPANWVFVR